jgi:hypothetical protein
MRLVVAMVAATLLLLGAASVVSAGPATGTTSLSHAAHTDSPVEVLVSITSESPVVAYEYSLVNQCWFSGRYAGHYDSYERFDLVGPWFQGTGGAAVTTETINLQPVPAGAVCKVFIVKGNTTLKGSTTEYTVVP